MLPPQEQAAASEALQQQLQSATSERDTLQSEAATLCDRLAELVEVQEELAVLQGQHEAVTTCLAQLEEQHEVCTRSLEDACHLLNIVTPCTVLGQCTLGAEYLAGS